MPVIPDFAYGWRPFAASNMIFKQIETRSGDHRNFVIDPGTQHWAIVDQEAERVLRAADGKTRYAEMIRKGMVADPEQLANELIQAGVIYNTKAEHDELSVDVYNSCEPVGLHIEITNACNMTCTHCYVASGVKLPNEMSDEEVFAAIDMLSPFSGKRIAISGGEPIVRRGCMEIVEYAALRCGHDVDLYTNGRKFPRKFAERIREINGAGMGNVRLQLSLEGATSVTHDLVRGTGAFDDAMESLQLFSDAGLAPSTVLFVCLTKANIDDVDDLIRLAEDSGVGMLVFSQWQRQGNAAGTPWASIAPTTEQWVSVGEKLLRYRNPKLRVYGNFFGDLTNGGPFCLDSPLFPKHVYYYNAFPRITPQGDIFADQLWVDRSWILGNLRNGDSLERCFHSPKFHGQLDQMRQRTDRIAECAACEWRALCEGGSPGHTFAEYGHMDARDLFCESRKYWFERYVQEKVRALI
jgi:radical SAM protein with 4Fe4S-binding SPASM domain